MAESPVPEKPTAEVIAGMRWHRCGSPEYTKLGLVMVFGWLLWGSLVYTAAGMASYVLPPWRLLGSAISQHGLYLQMLTVFVPGVIAFVAEPVIGFWSDRHRGPRGRRIPFLLYSTPFVSATLVAIAWWPEIGSWLAGRFAGVADPRTVQLVTFGVLAGVLTFLFQFTSVYYYLLKDLLPARYYARFRAGCGLAAAPLSLVSMHSMDWAPERLRLVVMGAAILFGIGFPLMCYRLREPEYPPPPPLRGNRKGFGAAVITFFGESFRHPFYLAIYGFGTCLWIAGLCNAHYNLFALHLGMTLQQVGQLQGMMMIPTFFGMLLGGYLADRWHPVRVVMWTVPIYPLLSLAGFLFVRGYESYVVFSAASFAVNIFYGAAAGAMLLWLFPQDRFGQFSAARSMVQAVFAMLASPLAGIFMNAMKALYGGNEDYQRWMYIWSAFFQAAAVYCLWRVYRGWQRYGGLTGYQPPAVGPVSSAAPSATTLPR